MKKLAKYKGVFIILVLAALIIMYYRHMSNITKGKEDEEVVQELTAVETVLDRNLTTNYPQSPKEVVKYFSEITQCFYNEDYSEEELEKLADKMLLLYDDELVDYKNHQDYLFDLQTDINYYKLNNYKISSFTPSPSTDVERFTQDGYEWARTWCVYTIKSGKFYKVIQEVFILRKDEKSHWRIYGWKLVEDEEET